jgi:hypothetical protein
MGSVKLKDLKAYVRYDGSGRVVAGSLVFRKKKPRNGRWVEITKNQCCNPIPIPPTSTTTTTNYYPTTTTTTSNGGGGVMPRAWLIVVFPTAQDACNGNTGYGPYIVYTPGNNLTTGITLWLDAALTIPYSPYPGRPWITANTGSVTTNAFYVEFNGSTTTVTSDVSCSTITTTTTQAPALSFIGRSGSTSNEACTSAIAQTFYTTGPLMGGYYPQAGNIIYFDQAMTQPVTQPYVSSPGYGSVFDCNNGVLSNMQFC